MKSERELKEELSRTKLESKANDIGVTINDEHKFGKHWDQFQSRTLVMFLLLIYLVVLVCAMIYLDEFVDVESKDVARDLRDLKGFCEENPQGVIDGEKMYVDCVNERVVISLGDVS